MKVDMQEFYPVIIEKLVSMKHHLDNTEDVYTNTDENDEERRKEAKRNYEKRMFEYNGALKLIEDITDTDSSDWRNAVDALMNLGY